MMETALVGMQKTDEPARPGGDGLYAPSGELEERGGYRGHVAESSLYTKATMHPIVTGAVALGVGVAIAGLMRPSSRD